MARRGPLARAPGALKSHNAEKLKGGPFGVFQHPFCRKTSKKIERGKILFSEKNLSAEKNCKGDPLGFSNIHSDAKQQKNWGGAFGEKIFEKKSRCAETWKGGPFGLARYGMLRGKTGKTFLVQFARPISAIWCNNVL